MFWKCLYPYFPFQPFQLPIFPIVYKPGLLIGVVWEVFNLPPVVLDHFLCGNTTLKPYLWNFLPGIVGEIWRESGVKTECRNVGLGS